MHDVMEPTVDGLENSTLATLLSGERFWPDEPSSVEESGLPGPFVESLLCKLLLANGKMSGRHLSKRIALPYKALELVFTKLRTHQLITHAGAAPLNDYMYQLTESGKREAQIAYEICRYLGPAPVPLKDYVVSVEAQAISDEAIRRDELEAAFRRISVTPELLNLMGPAINSASGMFLHGAPGNGKSTLAQRITACFGQEIWIPHALIEDDSIIKILDPAYHQEIDLDRRTDLRSSNWDRRWVRIKRPTVMVGGELRMEGLEIRHDAVRNLSEAPLQMKSNCGCLLIDDFGRQQISPAELLNRWIVPLECRHDFLTLATGKRIVVPFEQLVIFSTNLEPSQLVDEAFLRRIPYKIEVEDPVEDEFHELFQLQADQLGCEYNSAAVDDLLEKHYRPLERELRRCHPRDIMKQVNNYCKYHGLPLKMSMENFDQVAGSFFTNCLKTN